MKIEKVSLWIYSYCPGQAEDNVIIYHKTEEAAWNTLALWKKYKYLHGGIDIWMIEPQRVDAWKVGNEYFLNKVCPLEKGQGDLYMENQKKAAEIREKALSKLTDEEKKVLGI